MKKHPVPSTLRRTLYLRRRPLAASCAFVAVLATLLALLPPPPTMIEVVATRSALPGGTVLTADHLTTVSLPPDMAPVGATQAIDEAVGRTLAGPVAARSALTATSLSDGERLAREGHVLTSLPLGTGAIADLVRPGVRIDLLDPSGEPVATDVRVVAQPDTPNGGSFGMGVSSRSIVVEVPASAAARLASLGASPPLIVVR